MIMFTLHPSQTSHGHVRLSVQTGLDTIQEIANQGVEVHTTDFEAQDGTRVIVFWTYDASGQVATVWEYTMTYFPNIPVTGEIRLVQAREHALQDAATASPTPSEYSKGE